LTSPLAFINESNIGEFINNTVDDEAMKWLGNTQFSMGDITFTIDVTPGSQRRLSTDKNFTLVKNKSYIQNYEELGRTFSHILELGLFQGGSLVFLDKLLKPKKMVGLDIMKNKIQALENYIQADAGHIKTYYGASQDDSILLENIVKDDLDGELDLVVDDASHSYELTKKSFMVLFPLMKAGGTYLIEDWAWSHGMQAQLGGHPWEKNPAMTNLIYEIIAELGGGSDIEDIYINRNLLKIRKKKSENPQGGVLVKDYIRGRKRVLI
jgi:hypothetical protein